MSTRAGPLADSTLSPRIRDLLIAREPWKKQDLQLLTASERQELESIAVGKIEGVSLSDRSRAFHGLALAGGDRPVRLLRDVIADPTEPRELRALAASGLSLVPTRESESELIEQLSVDDDLILTRVIQAIGRIGTTRGFQALQQLSPPDSPAARGQLTFARTLIAYRLDLDDEPMDFAEGMDRDRETQAELLTLSLRRVRSKKVRATRDLLEGSEYGIEVHDKSAFEVTVGRAKWMLLLNAQAARGGLARTIGEKKLLLGLMTRFAWESGTYSVQYVVLTRPAGDRGVQIMVVRTDGELCYSGRASTSAGLLSFTVADIQRPGTAPTNVRGKLGPQGLRLEVSLTLGSREGKRRTVPLELPDGR